MCVYVWHFYLIEKTVMVLCMAQFIHMAEIFNLRSTELEKENN